MSMRTSKRCCVVELACGGAAMVYKCQAVLNPHLDRFSICAGMHSLSRSSSVAVPCLVSTGMSSPSTAHPIIPSSDHAQFPHLPAVNQKAAAAPSSSHKHVIMSTQLTPRYHTCAASKTAPKRAANRRSPRLHSQILPPPSAQSTLDAPPTPLQPGPSAWHQHEEGMELDVTVSPAVRRGTTPAALSLHSQSDKFLSLDLHIDAFWKRLRLGYAQDPDFRDPPRKYFFDKRLHVYFRQGKLVIPNNDFLRRQVLLWHHVHPMPQYLVRWKGYDQSHDSWLPVDELSGCLDKVSEYLFHSASASQRRKLINVFPRTLRDNLAHVVARADRTRRPAIRGGSPESRMLYAQA